MNQNNFITWEQATKLNVVRPVAEQYEENILQLVLYFSKNTLAQLLHGKIYFKAMELHQVYRDKDYSQYLFTETQGLLDAAEKAKIELEPAKETFQKLATLLSSQIKQK